MQLVTLSTEDTPKSRSRCFRGFGRFCIVVAVLPSKDISPISFSSIHRQFKAIITVQCLLTESSYILVLFYIESFFCMSHKQTLARQSHSFKSNGDTHPNSQDLNFSAFFIRFLLLKVV